MENFIFIVMLYGCVVFTSAFPAKDPMELTNNRNDIPTRLDQERNLLDIINLFIQQKGDNLEKTDPEIIIPRPSVRKPRNRQTMPSGRIVKRSLDTISNRRDFGTFSGDDSVRHHLQRLLELHRQQQARQNSDSEPLAIEIVLPILRQNRNRPAFEEEYYYEEFPELFH